MMDEFGPKPRLHSLLDHFLGVYDPREAWRLVHCGGRTALSWRMQLSKTHRHRHDFTENMVFYNFSEGCNQSHFLAFIKN